MEEYHLESVYRIYVTDAIKEAGASVAGIAGGKSMSKRYVDFLPGMQKEETRTEEEVKAQVLGRLNILREG